MKSSDEDFSKLLKNITFIKNNGVFIFQQNLFCEQNIKKNKQFVDKPISLHYKQEVKAK